METVSVLPMPDLVEFSAKFLPNPIETQGGGQEHQEHLEKSVSSRYLPLDIGMIFLFKGCEKLFYCYLDSLQRDPMEKNLKICLPRP